MTFFESLQQIRLMVALVVDDNELARSWRFEAPLDTIKISVDFVGCCAILGY